MGLSAIIVAVNTSAFEFRFEEFLENVPTTLKSTGYYFGFPLAPQSLAALLKAGGSLIPASDQA